MLIHQEPKSVSSTDSIWSVGVWKGNTAHYLHGMLKQVYVESLTAGVTFKFKLIDNQSRILYDSKDYAEDILNSNNLEIPIKGIYEMQIYDSSLADDFKILLGIEEIQ